MTREQRKASLRSHSALCLGRPKLTHLLLLCSSLMAVSLYANKLEAQDRVVTISEVKIIGRVQKPIAAVDVSRIQPKLTLGELRQSFSDRIERALYRAPF